MTAAIQFVIDVLSLGGAYALMALGLVIVYGILRLVNFAYGELIMVAGYALFLLGGSPLPWLVMAALAVLAAAERGGQAALLVPTELFQAPSDSELFLQGKAFGERAGYDPSNSADRLGRRAAAGIVGPHGYTLR